MPTTAFRVVCAPGKSRPRMAAHRVTADADSLVSHLLSVSGIGGVTEHPLTEDKVALRTATAGHCWPLTGSADCQVAWSQDWRVNGHHTARGCRGVPAVAPVRHDTVVTLTHRTTGLKVGVVAVHMHPGGWARHPKGRQRIPGVRRLIRRLWRQHRDRIRARLVALREHCDVVVLLGDINRPEGTPNPWPAQRRIDRGDLTYLGVWVRPGLRWDHTPAASYVQEADHNATYTLLTVTKG